MAGCIPEDPSRHCPHTGVPASLSASTSTVLPHPPTVILALLILRQPCANPATSPADSFRPRTGWFCGVLRSSKGYAVSGEKCSCLRFRQAPRRCGQFMLNFMCLRCKCGYSGPHLGSKTSLRRKILTFGGQMGWSVQLGTGVEDLGWVGFTKR